MMHRPLPHAQRGAILIVGLIILMVITVLVTTAFKFSNSSLKTVSNMQMRNEAIASANAAIEQALDLWTFESVPSHDPFEIDIDRNGSIDYVVALDNAVCVSAISTVSPDAPPSEVVCYDDGRCEIPKGGGEPVYNVTWDVEMKATGAGGTSVAMHQGVSRTISQAQCDAACPPGPGKKCI